MNNNLYGGILYPNTAFHFDKIYTSFKDANLSANTDGVLLGRYVLIAYTDKPLDQSQRVIAQSHVQKENGEPESEIVSEHLLALQPEVIQQYVQKLLDDNGEDYDRIVCRKVYNGNSFQYKPIANLSTSIDLYNTENNAFLNEFKELLGDFDSIDNNLDEKVKEGTEIIAALDGDEGLIAEGNTLNGNLTASISDAIKYDGALVETNGIASGNITSLGNLNSTSKEYIDIFTTDSKPNEGEVDGGILYLAEKFYNDITDEIAGAEKLNKTLEQNIDSANEINTTLEQTTIPKAEGISSILDSQFITADEKCGTLAESIEETNRIATDFLAFIDSKKEEINQSQNSFSTFVSEKASEIDDQKNDFNNFIGDKASEIDDQKTIFSTFIEGKSSEIETSKNNFNDFIEDKFTEIEGIETSLNELQERNEEVQNKVDEAIKKAEIKAEEIEGIKQQIEDKKNECITEIQAQTDSSVETIQLQTNKGIEDVDNYAKEITTSFVWKPF